MYRDFEFFLHIFLFLLGLGRENNFLDRAEEMGDTFSDWTEDTGEIVSCWTMEMILSGTERQKRQQATSRAIAMHAIAIGKATA